MSFAGTVFASTCIAFAIHVKEEVQPVHDAAKIATLLLAFLLPCELKVARSSESEIVVRRQNPDYARSTQGVRN